MGSSQESYSSKKDPRIIQANDELACSARWGEEEEIKHALGQGANPNHVGRFGHPPLWLCAERGHAHCLETLVNAGAKLNFSASNNLTALAAAATRGHIAAMEELLRLGASVHGNAKGEMSPLLWVAEMSPQNLAAAQLLIAHGADPLARDLQGRGVLDILTREMRGERLASLIMAMGADPRQASAQGRSPLEESARRSQDRMGQDNPLLLAFQAVARSLTEKEALEALPVTENAGHSQVKKTAPRI